MTQEEMQKQIESMMPTPKQIVDSIDRKLEEKREAAAVKYAEKNHIWLKDAIPSLAAMKSFKDGAEWMHSETINKACEWLKDYLDDDDTEAFLIDFKRAMEEQQ